MYYSAEQLVTNSAMVFVFPPAGFAVLTAVKQLLLQERVEKSTPVQLSVKFAVEYQMHARSSHHRYIVTRVLMESKCL